MSAAGYIYAIESGDAVKIGFSKVPARRAGALQIGSASDCRLIGFVEGTRDDEIQLHEEYAAQRIRGEWFRRDGVAKFISSLPPMTPAERKRGRKIEAPLRSMTGRARAIQALIAVADIYSVRLQISEATVSSRVFNDGKLIGRIVAGADITVARFERAMVWFSENWPDDALWPIDVSRPDRVTTDTERVAS